MLFAFLDYSLSAPFTEAVFHLNPELIDSVTEERRLDLGILVFTPQVMGLQTCLHTAFQLSGHQGSKYSLLFVQQTLVPLSHCLRVWAVSFTSPLDI